MPGAITEMQKSDGRIGHTNIAVTGRYMTARHVGAKKIYGKFFHVSPEGVKHTDVLHNSFARRK